MSSSFHCRPLAPRRRVLAGAAVALLFTMVSMSCATVKVDPDFYRAKKIAVVAYHGSASVPGLAGVVALLQSANRWGTDVVDELYELSAARIAQAMNADGLAAADVVNAPSYATLNVVNGDRASPKGLRPLSDGETDEVNLGALANELDVDAVVTVRFEWRIEADSDGNQRGVADMDLLVVGRDGKRLWKQSELAYGSAPRSWTQIGVEMMGALSEETVKAMIQDATKNAIESFAEAVKKNRE